MTNSVSQKIRASLIRSPVQPQLSLEEERRQWEDAVRDDVIAEGCSEKAEEIAGTRCLWLLPDNPQNDDILLYAHGGGLVTGAIETHRVFCSQIAVALNRTILLVGYRRLPEHQATAPRDDFLAVYSLLINEGTNSDRIAFAGDSSGATVVLSALVRLREKGTDLPYAAVSLSGAFDTSLSGESFQSRAEVDPVLSPESLIDWQKHFIGRIDLADPVISPLFAELHNLPPFLLLAGDHELWLSDSVRMAERLKAQGTDSSLSVYADMWHVWPMWPELPETAKAFLEIDRFLTRTQQLV
ncbi:alpha/beta hydrolase [uncultured Roseibium sp.]|uniref:alpha/beta hydrolase n=1 Tax=uncultured Roseibium sp. TaxID=1936171 RepID=UPI002615401F|nr:alpha/beta hydrolase [uncultured Roseibium sp.]